MAQTFQDVFGDMLVVAPVDKNETMLPSPEKLKRKIILKHKKLPEGCYDEAKYQYSHGSSADTPNAGGDIANSVKNGTLYIKDNDDLGWQKHFFCLTGFVLKTPLTILIVLLCISSKSLVCRNHNLLVRDQRGVERRRRRER